MKDVCKDRITRKEYNKMTPYHQGYTSYMQAAWDYSEIPDELHYPAGSKDAEQWLQGRQVACIHVMDIDS